MKQYDNTNSGLLMRNENRTTDSHPEFTGSLNVEGRDFWVSAWVNTGKPGSKIEGKRYFSIKLSPKDAPNRGNTGRRNAATDFDDIDDDIPF